MLILATLVSRYPHDGSGKIPAQAERWPARLGTRGSELSPPSSRHLPFPLAVAPGAREHAGGRGVLVWECEPAL